MEIAGRAYPHVVATPICCGAECNGLHCTVACGELVEVRVWIMLLLGTTVGVYEVTFIETMDYGSGLF